MMFPCFRSAFAAALLMACAAVGAVAQIQPNPKAFALVNGRPVTEEEVRQFAAGDLQNLELRRLQAEKGFEHEKQTIYDRTLTMLVGKSLVESEAKKQGMPPEALIALQVESKVVPPTDQEIRQFYEENKSQIAVSGDEALNQVRTYLRQQRRDTLYVAYVDKLRKENDVQTYFQLQRTNLETNGFPTKGPASAPVTIVEFADFECPFCDALFPTLQKIEQDYGDKLRIIYRQFPLGHPHSQKAALASLCAFEQHKFWEMHDAIFQDAAHMDVDSLKQKAAALNLDSASFNACLDSSKYADAVNKDLQDGSSVGVSGTPSLFINGRFLAGNAPYEAIQKIVDEELLKGVAVARSPN